MLSLTSVSLLMYFELPLMFCTVFLIRHPSNLCYEVVFFLAISFSSQVYKYNIAFPYKILQKSSFESLLNPKTVWRNSNWAKPTLDLVNLIVFKRIWNRYVTPVLCVYRLSGICECVVVFNLWFSHLASGLVHINIKKSMFFCSVQYKSGGYGISTGVMRSQDHCVEICSHKVLWPEAWSLCPFTL